MDSALIHIKRACWKVITTVDDFHSGYKAASQEEIEYQMQIGDEKKRLEGIASLLLDGGVFVRLAPDEQYEFYKRFVLTLHRLQVSFKIFESRLKTPVKDGGSLISIEDFQELLGRISSKGRSSTPATALQKQRQPSPAIQRTVPHWPLRFGSSNTFKLQGTSSTFATALQEQLQPSPAIPRTMSLTERLYWSSKKSKLHELLDLVREVGDGLENRLYWSIVRLLSRDSAGRRRELGTLPSLSATRPVLIQHAQIAGMGAPDTEDVELPGPHPVTDPANAAKDCSLTWGTREGSPFIIEIQSIDDRYLGLENEIKRFFLNSQDQIVRHRSLRYHADQSSFRRTEGELQDAERRIIKKLHLDGQSTAAAAFAILRQDLADLAKALRQAHCSPLFSRHLLHCRGFYAIPTAKQVCLAFEPPFPVCACRRLEDVLEGAYLEDKVKVAKALAELMYGLHSASLFHRNFCSRNIVFFLSKDDAIGNMVDWARPYVLGFNRSRRMSGPARTLCGSVDWDLYYQDPHKMRELHGEFPKKLLTQMEQEVERARRDMETLEKSSPFTRRYDLRSLGVVLLEVALGTNADELCRKICKSKGKQMHADSAWDRQADFIEVATELLKEEVGQSYFDAVLACLTARGDLGSEDEDDVKYLAAFREEIYAKLFSILV